MSKHQSYSNRKIQRILTRYETAGISAKKFAKVENIPRSESAAMDTVRLFDYKVTQT